MKTWSNIHKRTINKWSKQVIEDSLEGFLHDSDRDMPEQYRDERNLFEKHKTACLSKVEVLCKEHYQKETELLMKLFPEKSTGCNNTENQNGS